MHALPAVLGELKPDEDIQAWLRSGPVRVEALGGRAFRFVFEASTLAAESADLAGALENLLRPGLDLLAQAQPQVFDYYRDTLRRYPHELPATSIARPADVWRHVTFGETIQVRRAEGGVYLSIECSCEWEPEHGLQLVFRDGDAVAKVGRYDGRLTPAEGPAGRSR